MTPVTGGGGRPSACPRLVLGLTRVELDIPETLPMVAVDPGLLERSVANRVENAFKYSPPGEAVLVAASAIADRVEVRVVDRGPGVPDEAKDRIFEPFQRYGDTPRGAGVGLGLAVARASPRRSVALSTPRTPQAADSPWCSASRPRSAAGHPTPAIRRPPPPRGINVGSHGRLQESTPPASMDERSGAVHADRLPSSWRQRSRRTIRARPAPDRETTGLRSTRTVSLSPPAQHRRSGTRATGPYIPLTIPGLPRGTQV